MAVTRLKRKARKNKTVGRLKQQHIKLNKRVILIKSPNKVNQHTGETAESQTASLPVNEATPAAEPKKKETASKAETDAQGAEASAEPKKRAPKSNAETQVDSGAIDSGNGKTDTVDEVGGKGENTPVE